MMTECAVVTEGVGDDEQRLKMTMTMVEVDDAVVDGEDGGGDPRRRSWWLRWNEKLG
ncbi:hypothetical protein Hanom_Chr16g01489661 [Helianthus anomalus]